MNSLNNYIIEKLKINSKSKIYSYDFSQEIQDLISDELCRYFQASCSFKGNHYDNKLEIIDKFYHYNICEFFDDLDLWEDIYTYILYNIKNDSIKFNDLKNYIYVNKIQLYKDIKDFVL